MKTHKIDDSVRMKPLEIYATQLPNGVRLIVQPDHSAEVVSVQGWVQTGSITEDRYLGAGISHLLEHMLFKGTQKRTGDQISHEIQAVGGYLNAYTSFDRTVYYADLPSAGWKIALDVLSDAVFRSALPKDEFDKEREVIRREFAMGKDNPDQEIQKLLFRTAFVTHPYRHPIIGHLELFDRLTHEDLLNYYQSRYIPDNVTWIVSGDVDPREVEQELLKLTSDLPRKSLAPVYIPAEPAQLGKREAHENFPTDVVRIFMAWHIPGITHPDLYALDVLASIMGHGNSSRLYQELVEKRKILRDVSAFSYTPAQAGLWGVSATLQPGENREEAQKAILEVLKKVVNTVTAAEISKAKRQAITERASELKTASGRASSIGSGWLVAQNVRFDENYLRALQKVARRDLQRVFKTYFKDENWTIVSLSPLEEKRETKSKNKTAHARAVQLEKLKSGARLVMVTDDKVPLVTIRLSGGGGILAETAKNNGIGKLTVRLLSQGTKKRTAAQIATQIENLGGSLNTDFGNNSFSISIEVLENDLEKAMELLADVALNASFPKDEIEKEKAKQFTDIKLEADQPMAIARNAMRATLFKEHPYALNPLGTEATLPKLTRENIVAYHQKLMTSGNIVFSIGGSFDPVKAKKLFAKYFSKLPEGKEIDKKTSAAFADQIQEKIISTNKEQAIIQIGYPGVSIDSPDRPALEIVDEALSDMGSRLFIRVREKQSLAYFVGSGQLIGVNRGAFIFYAGTARQTSQKAKTEIMDEIKIIAQKGLSNEEIERARAKLLGQKLLEDQSASAVAYRSALNELYGLGLHYEDTVIEKIRTITPPEINTAAEKYFSNQNFVSILVQPTKN